MWGEVGEHDESRSPASARPATTRSYPTWCAGVKHEKKKKKKKVVFSQPLGRDLGWIPAEDKKEN